MFTIAASWRNKVYIVHYELRSAFICQCQCFALCWPQGRRGRRNVWNTSSTTSHDICSHPLYVTSSELQSRSEDLISNNLLSCPFYRLFHYLTARTLDCSTFSSFLLRFFPLSFLVRYVWQTKARFPFKRNRLCCVRCVNENRKKRKRLRWQAANHSCHYFDRAFLLAGAYASASQ